MIRKTEKYYKKRVRTFKGWNRSLNTYGYNYMKKTTYWLFYIVPIFVTNEVQKGVYQG